MTGLQKGETVFNCDHGQSSLNKALVVLVELRLLVRRMCARISGCETSAGTHVNAVALHICTTLLSSLENYMQVAIFTANSESLHPMLDEIAEACGVSVSDKRYVIVGCETVPGFEAVALGEKVDTKKVQPGIVALAKKTISEHPSAHSPNIQISVPGTFTVFACVSTSWKLFPSSRYIEQHAQLALVHRPAARIAASSTYTGLSTHCKYLSVST